MLTKRQTEYLSAIKELGEKSTQANIARKLGVSREAVREPIRKLIQKGLIEKVKLNREVIIYRHPTVYIIKNPRKV